MMSNDKKNQDESALIDKIYSALQSSLNRMQAAYLTSGYSPAGSATSKSLLAVSSTRAATSTTDSLSVDDLLKLVADLGPPPKRLEITVAQTPIRDRRGRPVMIDLTATSAQMDREFWGDIPPPYRKDEPYRVLVDREGLRELEKAVGADLLQHAKIRYLSF